MKIPSALKRNEIVRIAVSLVVIFISVQAGWLILKAAMRTEVPVAYVPSRSMEPTLNVGDLVIIQGVNPPEINVGTIIVFYVPEHYGEDAYRIVHRVVKVVQLENGLGFETKGDNNPVSDYFRWKYIPEAYVIGKVIYRIPYVGYLALKIREPIGITVIAFLIILLVALEYSDHKGKRGG
ncbi:MAG: signal peptidase I [Candidatus Bathyarchaeia archaeon]